jgi:predicted secreted protein
MKKILIMMLLVGNAYADTTMMAQYKLNEMTFIKGLKVGSPEYKSCRYELAEVVKGAPITSEVVAVNCPEFIVIGWQVK